MHKLILVLVSFIIIPTLLFSQEPILDTLYFKSGKIEAVEITGFNENSINYTYPNEGIPITISSGKLDKVVTRNGRVVKIESTSKVKKVNTCLDWDKVEITGIESEVEGLIRIANVSGKAEGATEFSSLEKMQSRAMSKMRMQAAFLGCDVVYMLNQTNTPLQSGLWTTTTATSTLSGTAYTASIVFPDDDIQGNYKLQEAYRLRPNDFELKNYDTYSLNKKLTISKEDFILDDDHYALNFDSGVEDSGNKMYLLAYNEELIVFLVIDRSKQSKLKYYNLFFERE